MNCLTSVCVCVCGSATPPAGVRCTLSSHLIVTLIGSGHSILISFRNGSRAASAIVGSCCLLPASCVNYYAQCNIFYKTHVSHTVCMCLSLCLCVCVLGGGVGVASWNYARANIYDAAAKAVEFNWVALRQWQWNLPDCSCQRAQFEFICQCWLGVEEVAGGREGRGSWGEHRLIICGPCEISSSTGDCNSNAS